MGNFICVVPLLGIWIVVLVGARRRLLRMAVHDPVGASILGLRHRDSELRASPSPDTVLGPGDIVVALGAREQLANLERLLSAAE